MVQSKQDMLSNMNAQDSAYSIELASIPPEEKQQETQEQPQHAPISTRPTHSFVKRDAETYGVRYRPEKQWGFWNPRQAQEKHMFWIKSLGRVGWGAKAVIYALIGGLACDNAVGNRNSSASPQGAFVLIGTANGGRGALVLLAVATATYSAWRYWEAIVGQGYDDNFSKWKNFFKFRLSPFVSGSVYIAYNVLICTTIPRDANQERDSLRNSTWPNNWRNSGIGKAGLVVCGLAFIAATIVQLEQFFTRSFHNTIKDKFYKMPAKYWKAFRIFVLVTGHLGVLGRAGIFAFAAVLFFRTLEKSTYQGKSAFGDALAQLQDTRAGLAALFIMGFLVILYGLFATLNIYARYFPTPPPTGYKKQHRRQYDPDGILPQYGSHQSGFNPMGAAASRLHGQTSGLSGQPSAGLQGQPSAGIQGQPSAPLRHEYLSPMTNAANHRRTASAENALQKEGNAQNHPGQKESGYATGYPATGNGNEGVTIRQVEDV